MSDSVRGQGAPRVSILIPVFNREDLVGPCIESALAQTVTDIEVVVVDNASTDGTWELLQQYERQDPRVRIFRNDRNLGPVRNWQRCFDEARGSVAKLLFSDDLIAPTFLERCAPYLDNPAVAFVYTAAEVGEEPGTGEVYYQRPDGTGAMTSAEFRSAAVGGAPDFPVSPGCALFRLPDLRASLRLDLPMKGRPGLSSHGAGADLLLFLLSSQGYPLVWHIDEPLAFFRHHAGSITIDGMNGEIAKSYRLTRYWFASVSPERSAWRVLGDQWLRGSRILGRPATRSDLYGAGAGAVSPIAFVAAISTSMVAKAMRRVGSRLRGHAH